MGSQLPSFWRVYIQDYNSLVCPGTDPLTGILPFLRVESTELFSDLGSGIEFSHSVDMYIGFLCGGAKSGGAHGWRALYSRVRCTLCDEVYPEVKG